MFVKQGQNLLKVVHFYDFFVKDLAQLLFQNSVEAPLSIVINIKPADHRKYSHTSDLKPENLPAGNDPHRCSQVEASRRASNA